jgi:hypothetical protein
MLGGMLGILGFAILLDNRVMESSDGYAMAVSPTAQGWAYLVAAIVSTVAAIFLLMGKGWARILTIALAAAVALLNFISLPGHEEWSIVIIGLNLGIIWALTFHGRELTG